MPRPGYKANVQLLDVFSWGWWLRQHGGVCLYVQWQGTPLHVAARKGKEAVTRALLEAGADVNAKTYLVQIKVQLWDVCSWGWWLR
jgi:hypothetical protein